MIRRIVLARICLVLGLFGIFIGFDSAEATRVCQSSTAVITISQPTTLTGLQLTGQTLRVATPLEIQGTLGGLYSLCGEINPIFAPIPTCEMG